MALLAPNSLVDKWYQTDSWVYKNFKFLFENPLWDKNIPRGFSLCPYFWTALFSLFVFKPIVYTMLFFVKIVKILRLKNYLESIDDFLSNKIYRIGTASRGLPAGFLATFSICLCVVACAITWVTYKSFSQIHIWYAEANILSALYLPLILLSVYSVCSVYAKKRNKLNRCKVEYYVYAAALICSGIMVMLHPGECASLFKAIGIGAVLSVEMIFKILWYIISILGVGIAHGVVWLSKWFISFVVSSLKWIVSFLIAGAFLAAGGYLFVKNEEKLREKLIEENTNRSEPVSESSVQKPERKLTEKEKFEDNKRKIIAYIYHRDYRVGKNTREWTKFFNSHDIPEFNLILQRGSDFVYSPKCDSELKDIIEKAYQIDKAEKLAAEQRQERWDARCNYVSSITGKIVRGVLWAPKTLLKYPIIGIIWTVKEGCTFIVLLWQLFWAWKKGACPYKMFVDPSKQAKTK